MSAVVWLLRLCLCEYAHLMIRRVSRHDLCQAVELEPDRAQRHAGPAPVAVVAEVLGQLCAG